MTTDTQEEDRRRHIDGFVDSFVRPEKRERYREFLLNPKKRRRFVDRLNHKMVGDLIAKHIVTKPPHSSLDAVAYLISDEREIDNRFVEAERACELVAGAHFGTIASFIPGVLVAFKEEAPAAVLWLHRGESK